MLELDHQPINLFNTLSSPLGTLLTRTGAQVGVLGESQYIWDSDRILDRIKKYIFGPYL